MSFIFIYSRFVSADVKDRFRCGVYHLGARSEWWTSSSEALVDNRKERSSMPWKSRLRCNQTNKRRSTGISGTGINCIFHFYLQQGVLRANDHHFPFINVIVIYKASWKALHRVLVELCNKIKKKTLLKQSQQVCLQDATGKVILMHLLNPERHSQCMCSACVEDANRSTTWTLIHVLHWQIPSLTTYLWTQKCALKQPLCLFKLQK